MECSCKKTKHILIEADFTDPVWCADCKVNLDLDEFPVSVALKQRIESWAEGYGKWLDWERDKLKSDAVKIEEDFNNEGRLLSVAVQQELHDFTITFRPSRLSSLYM
ncbi:hypothetical protein CHH69_06725 [Terribacillus saccharophilus]|uniref:hypothetical protein n=1 Tax=Terribacillus saccharophilus TaxID=361277 RepID=UPI000BA649C8|nr:hypothetical protein [Terribacillus saccharophilus]PAF39711.1 hypothetical protein CHH69_06725 [Terribacillus saccharophilus]